MKVFRTYEYDDTTLSGEKVRTFSTAFARDTLELKEDTFWRKHRDLHGVPEELRYDITVIGRDGTMYMLLGILPFIDNARIKISPSIPSGA